MSTFVIGDVHGSFHTLKALLKKIRFKEAEDRLWMVGDLVNRGSGSLEVLRWARDHSRSMGDRFVAVLGNHDLHLLALAAGVGDSVKPDLQPVLKASDRAELIAWLRGRPFVHRERIGSQDTLLVHAGLWPDGKIEDAQEWSERLSRQLQSPEVGHLLLIGPKALRQANGDLKSSGDALYAFNTLRTLERGKKRSPCRFAGLLAEIPDDCEPWFSAPGRKWRGTRVVFGHWAALGLHRTREVVGLDSGCAWGGRLTALRLEDGRIDQVNQDSRDQSLA